MNIFILQEPLYRQFINPGLNRTVINTELKRSLNKTSF